MFGHNYGGAAAALATTVVVMILIDTVHPPAVPTSLAFSLRSAPESNFALFALAVAIIAWLVVLERASLWLLNRLDGRLSRDSAAGRVRGSRSAHEPGGSPGGDAGDDGEDNTPEETPG